MFYAHTEGRRSGILRAINDGLEAASFNIVYPPSVEEEEAARHNLDLLVNPQSFRLRYAENTRPPRVKEFLRAFGTVSAHDMADFDDYDVPRSLNARGRALCDELYSLQSDFGATEILAPYFLSANPADADFEISILCADYLHEKHPEIVLFAGVMMDGSALENDAHFDLLANRVTSPDSPLHYYFDFDLSATSGRPLRNTALLDRLATLFNSMDSAGKYSLLARCNLEGLLLRAASGLDAFSMSYFQSERKAVHRTLSLEYEAPKGYRAPTPHLFAAGLMTDIPRDVAEQIVKKSHKRWLLCDCSSCNAVLSSAFSAGAQNLCAAHFYSCVNGLDAELAACRSRAKRIDLMNEWLEGAEGRAETVLAKSGTFAHIRKWREWLDGIHA